MSTVALLDMDKTGFPNIALGKLATWCRMDGHTVTLNPPNPEECDYVFASRIFTWSEPVPSFALTGDKLPEDIEHLRPDLSDYEVSDTAYGFTSRGCNRKCWFCSVWKREGMVRSHAHPSEFIREEDSKAILLDNNILASPNCFETLEWLISWGGEVDFNQGLDIRLVTPEIARLLKQVKMTTVRFAFDDLKDTEGVMHGVSLLRKYRVRPVRYEAYVLHTGDDEDTLKRIDILAMLYVDPFVMPFVEKDGSRSASKIARWCNRKHVYRKTCFEDYDVRIKGST